MGSWEYKLLSIKTKGGVVRQMNFQEDLVEQCNAAGREGWELVSTVPLIETRGRTQVVNLIFKRPR